LAPLEELLHVAKMLKGLPLLIITTRLPPQFCGAGTYSWLLHQHWPTENSQHRFLVIDGAAESIAALNYPGISEFHASAAELSNALERAGSVDVFLHYAGRAYHRFGCPTWMPKVLLRWKEKFPEGRLAIFFHELPGKVPITSRHYWLNLCNRRIIGKLATVADLLITNTQDHAEKLERISGCPNIRHFPVGSNIEVSSDLSEPRIRTEFAILGLPFGRWQTLEMFDREICSWQKTGGLTTLHLIGPGDQKFDHRSDRLIAAYPDVVKRHGELPSAEVSRLLSRVQFALTNVNNENWSKSGAFMAYAAHGCAVVSRSIPKAAPLSFTVPPEDVETVSDDYLRNKGESLRRWFEENADWKIIARQISGLFVNK
jgi:hypothetical protein